jgi:hypothetical protein
MPKAIMTKRVLTDKCTKYIASDSDGNRASVISDVVNFGGSDHDLAAIALCNKMGWSGTLVRGHLKQGHVYVWLPAREYREQALVRVQKQEIKI